MKIDESAKRRFWAKVNKSGPVTPKMNTQCWIWMGAKDKTGYGRFKINYKWFQATHVIWAIAKNKILPKKTTVYHHCNNNSCVNPEHLFIDDTNRFWRHVDKNGPTIKYVGTPCWVWTAGTVKGYGTFKPQKGKTVYAHRMSWIIHNGPIPKGKGVHGTCVLHKCDNRKCVNPAHLFLGSQKDNVRDMFHKNIKGKNGRAKLTNEQVIKIRKLYTTGNYTHRQLGKKFGLDKSSIGDIINRKSWKHL